MRQRVCRVSWNSVAAEEHKAKPFVKAKRGRIHFDMGEIIEYSGKHKRQKETLAEPGNHDLPRHRNVGKLDLQDMHTVGAVLGLTKE